MKLLRFADGATGVAGDPTVARNVAHSLDALGRVDSSGAELLRGLLPDGGRGSWSPLIEAWKQARPALERLAAGDVPYAPATPFAQVKLAAPLPGRRIFAIGGNWPIHMSAGLAATTGSTLPPEHFVEEKRRGLAPWGFIVLPETVIGPEATMSPPAQAILVDYEAEVAAVVATGGRNLKAAEVTFWGMTGWNDFSIRDPHFKVGASVDRGALKWTLQKNFDTANACGPVVAVDEGLSLDNLHIRLTVNGIERQNDTTAGMIYSFAEVVEHISAYTTIFPGDLIVSGTPPGVAAEHGIDGPYLKNGDVVEVEIEGVGKLRNHVVMTR